MSSLANSSSNSLPQCTYERCSRELAMLHGIIQSRSYSSHMRTCAQRHCSISDRRYSRLKRRRRLYRNQCIRCLMGFFRSFQTKCQSSIPLSFSADFAHPPRFNLMMARCLRRRCASTLSVNKPALLFIFGLDCACGAIVVSTCD